MHVLQMNRQMTVARYKDFKVLKWASCSAFMSEHALDVCLSTFKMTF
jgi:hypothetical protein